MALVNTCSHVLIGGYDISADLTDINVNKGSEQLDATTFGQDTRIKKGGLKTGTIDGGGYVNLGSSLSDPALFANVGVDNTLVTVFVNGITVGSTGNGHSMAGAQANYNFGGSAGVLLPFTFSAETRSDLVQATAAANALVTAWSTDSTGGTVIPISTAGWDTGEKLYAGLHVTAMSTTNAGTTLAVAVQQASSSGAGFTAAAVSRITFTTLSCSHASAWATPITTHSTDQPFWRALITMTCAATTGPTANGLVWLSMQR